MCNILEFTFIWLEWKNQINVFISLIFKENRKLKFFVFIVNPITKQFAYGQHTITLETGVIARQASAAVLASMDDTSVLVSVVGKKDANPDQ